MTKRGTKASTSSDATDAATRAPYIDLNQDRMTDSAMPAAAKSSRKARPSRPAPAADSADVPLGSQVRPEVHVPIPGPRGAAIVDADDRFLVRTTKTAPVTGVRGRGCVVEDADGNILLDFAAGIGVLNTGHCHPRVVAAVQEQAAKLMHFAGTDFYYDQQTRLADKLDRLGAVHGRAKSFFCQSGTEANEAAIKLAKAYTRRPLLLAFHGAFHGRTQGSLALTASKVRHKERFFSPMPGVTHVHYPNPYRNPWRIDGYADPDELTNRAIEGMEAVFDNLVPADEVAAVFFEPVQGEGGYVVPPEGFARRLRKLCDEHDILLVADEVQTGMGRTGRMLAMEHSGVKADITSLAKALGSGMPIGATVCAQRIDFDESGRHSNTYGGNLVACAAAIATLDVLQEEDLPGNAQRMGERMGKRLDELREKHPEIGDARGLGLMRAVEFVKPGTQGRYGQPEPDARLRDRVEEECWKRGLVLLGTGRSGVRFLPPLTVNGEQVDGAMDVFAEALQEAVR